MDEINSEKILEVLEEYYEKAKNFAEQLTPEQWAMIGGGVLLLYLISSLRRRAKRRRAAKLIAPNLVLHTFQIAPLGRDAFFKARNIGEVATIIQVAIKGRDDIQVKNAITGHKIGKEKICSLLLETSSLNKIDKNFTIELTFLDQKGNTYKQDFPLQQNSAKQAKRVKTR